MDDRVRGLVETTIQTIVGLDVALFYQENPSTFDTAEGVALRTHRNVADVRLTIERLVGGGLLERHERGEGRYTCYSVAPGQEAWDLLCLLSEAYIDDLESRKEIVRALVRGQKESREIGRGTESGGGGDGA